MLPTFNVRGDWVLISKLHRLGRGVRVGDLVTCRHPCRADDRFIKRVLGMPGDFVAKDPADGSGDMLQVSVPCWRPRVRVRADSTGAGRTRVGRRRQRAALERIDASIQS